MKRAKPKFQHKSFFDEIDHMVPPFVMTASMMTASSRGPDEAVMYSQADAVQRVYAVNYYDPVTGEPRDGEFTMPAVEYVRAMDPSGNILPLSVKTGQNPSCDAGGYENTIRSRKEKQGWLVCERDAAYRGYIGHEYGEYLRGEWLRRRAAHDEAAEGENSILIAKAAERQAAERAHQAELLQQQAEANRDMVANMVPAITEAVARAMAKRPEK